MEEWKDIKGYEELYQISSLGRVKSLKNNRGNYREKILSNIPNKNGYIIVQLKKNGTSKPFSVHRLVAQAFIPNPNNYPQVNHKDENKENNRVDNLEWCTAKYNSNYGTKIKRVSEANKGKYKGSKHPRARKILCVTTGKKFNCIKEAAEYYHMNPNKGANISACCRGKQKSAGKHPETGEKLIWRYL